MADWDYANARLRAMKGRLLDRRAYAELAALARIEDLIARLAQSLYASEIEAALARYVGPRVVMEACRLHLANAYRKIRGFFAGDGARLVGLLLARWDLSNLKTILRGQEAGARPEEILEALVPAGDLDESALRMLVRQAGPVATADLLQTWNVGYGRAVRAALAELARTHDWSTLETTLDTLFYAGLLASLKKGAENDELVREMLGREIDAANVVTALRLQRASVPLSDEGAARHFLDGGGLSREWLKALARSARPPDALALLRGSKFGPALAGLETLDLARIQRALDRDLAKFGIAFFTRDPLTMATAIGWITAKGVEVANVRLIAQGVALGVSRAEIENDLIVV